MAETAERTLYVTNGGLVVFAPFLPRFFERLGLLTPGADGVPRIAGTEAVSRAVHLLQYLVDLRCDRPEADLVLNKLLCGVAPDFPVAPSIDPTADERETCAHVTSAVIENWTILRNTSADGLRETFVQREARLREEEAGWRLNVQRKTLDVLVDQIPWTIDPIYHRWMPELLHVVW